MHSLGLLGKLAVNTLCVYFRRRRSFWGRRHIASRRWRSPSSAVTEQR